MFFLKNLERVAFDSFNFLLEDPCVFSFFFLLNLSKGALSPIHP